MPDIELDIIQNDGISQIVICSAEDREQQKIFEKIEMAITDASCLEKDKIIKIWCEGHLPIRSIRVSPCIDQEQVFNSIKHYCLHKAYWMKYVDVYKSSIPYRRPR